MFDTAATVRSLEATACREAAEVAEPVTQSVLEAALANLESKVTWRLVLMAGAVVTAIKLIPSPY